MISENYKIVPVAHANDLNVGVIQVTDSINMKGFHKATFILQFHTLGGASATLKVFSGATDAALTSALPFNYAFGGAAQGSADCDVLAAWAASENLTIDHTAKSDAMLVIEVNASGMDVNNSENWLTIETTDPTGATGLYTCIAILEARYTGNRSASALA